MANSLSLALYLATRKRGKPLDYSDTFPMRPDGPLIWFHTGQDLQALGVREFAGRLKSEREDLNFLLTSDVEMETKSEPYMILHIIPDEASQDIQTFLDRWRPDIAIWTEADHRPALIAEVNQRHIPIILADAHAPDPNITTHRWWPGISGTLLSGFDHILTGNKAMAARYQRLGAKPEVTEIKGFLEEGTPALTHNEADRNSIAHGLGGRPVWLAMSVTDAEKDAVITAHHLAQHRAHRLLLILNPDDPGKGPDWARDLIRDGHNVALRSAGEEPNPTTQIYVADTRDEAGLWYRLAAIAFLGQSLDSGGGVNPFEAAALGSAILHGPNIGNFRRSYDRLSAVGAARLVRDADMLGEMVETLLSPDIAASMAHEAWKVCSAGAEVTDRMLDLVLTRLDDGETA